MHLHCAQVSGENVLPPIDSFESADLRPFILANVKKSGYTKPTPVQKNALPVIMAGRDLMACAQTGSGKTVSMHEE
jgi:probable ATP-dependent RNA helicase DDX4